MTYATLISGKSSVSHAHTHTHLVSVLTLCGGRSRAALFPLRSWRAGRRSVAGGFLLWGATEGAAARALASTLGAATAAWGTRTRAAPAAGTTPTAVPLAVLIQLEFAPVQVSSIKLLDGILHITV